MQSEKRLIDLDRVLKPYEAAALLDPYEYIPPLMVVKDLESQPIVDAVEVVHGRWIEHIEIGAMNNHYECSACHWKTPSFTIAKGSNYCPNCGAKMDGDGDG